MCEAAAHILNLKLEDMWPEEEPPPPYLYIFTTLVLQCGRLELTSCFALNPVSSIFRVVFLFRLQRCLESAHLPPSAEGCVLHASQLRRVEDAAVGTMGVLQVMNLPLHPVYCGTLDRETGRQGGCYKSESVSTLDHLHLQNPIS